MAKYLVTGGAGFIGSHLAQKLLADGEEVVVLDNLSTGSLKNIDHLRDTKPGGARLSFHVDDICASIERLDIFQGVDTVYHLAALGSVPRSIADPIATTRVNVSGFVAVVEAARRAGVRRIVYASSSSVYGNLLGPMRQEGAEGDPLSPYAASKRANELYASSFNAVYGTELIGLRFFNVFGPRQSSSGAYAAVIPKWIRAAALGLGITVYGDGEQSRDFTYIDNVVHALTLAASPTVGASAEVYNVGSGENISLNALLRELTSVFAEFDVKSKSLVSHGATRLGDVRASTADLWRVSHALGYSPLVPFREGLRRTVSAYLSSR